MGLLPWCRADVQAGPTVYIGTQTGTWGNTEPVCLRPQDMNADGTFSLAYSERNADTEGLAEILSGYRNRILNDMTVISNSGRRPGLTMGQSRDLVPWDYPLDLGQPDAAEHTPQPAARSARQPPRPHAATHGYTAV